MGSNGFKMCITETDMDMTKILRELFQFSGSKG